MLRIYQAQTDGDRSRVRELFLEYLEWLYTIVFEEYGVSIEAKAVLESDMANLQSFDPPDGRLLLATEGSRLAGIGCLRRIRDDTGEIKRMYVRPEFRGKGIGRALLEELLAQAQVAGYKKVYLDSGHFMKAAHSLYRSAGFHEIEPYPESEIPVRFQATSIFMEKRL